MGKFVPVEELFKGRHCDREIVVLCVRWFAVQVELPRSSRDDERARDRLGAHDDPGGDLRAHQRGMAISLRAVDKDGQTVDFI
jgi:hypothetical protein